MEYIMMSAVGVTQNVLLASIPFNLSHPICKQDKWWSESQAVRDK